IQPDSSSSDRSRKDSLYMPIWSLCLQKDAICPVQCTNNIPKVHAIHFL
ncbi:hypothetical protein A2U01_0084650, partial [Trifolium medium]|nr:hypothetical protein [Trifolium medium]